MTEFEEIMQAEIEAVNKALAEYLEMRIQQVENLGSIHQQYYGNMKKFMMRGGKRFRPVAVVIAYKAVQENVDIKHLYRAACSVEVLHNASLLHDDVIDHDETRRGGPTFHALYRDWFKTNLSSNEENAKDFGMTMAILGGDSLLNMGAEIISASELDAEHGMKCQYYYQVALRDIVEGVLLEMHMIKDPNVTPEVYLEMIRLKTAVLFENSLLMGGTLAGATESQIKALSEYGVKVGQAFQIQDDILGSFGDEKVTGKSTDGDIREGKKTMLLLDAIKRADASQKKSLSDLMSKDTMSPEDVDAVREILKSTGALDSSGTLMNNLLQEGQDALKNAKPPFNEKYMSFLIELSDFLVKRNY